MSGIGQWTIGVAGALLCIAGVASAGSQETFVHIDVTDSEQYKGDISQLWESRPESVSFRDSNEARKLYLYQCCRRRWLTTPSGDTFDARDPDMREAYQRVVVITDSLGEDYFRWGSHRVLNTALKPERDDRGRAVFRDLLLRNTNGTHTYTNAAGAKVTLDVYSAVQAAAISPREFVKHLRSITMGIVVEIPIQRSCRECRAKGFQRSRSKLGKKIPCDACRAVGFTITYRPVTVTW